ncbi:transposase [Pontibacter sp. CAU 1760]
MPSHLHMICTATEPTNLSHLLRDFKSYTAQKIIQLIENNPQESRKEWMVYLFKYYAKGSSYNSVFQFWQQHNHPTDLTSAEMIQQTQDYLHANPVEARLVTEAQ